MGLCIAVYWLSGLAASASEVAPFAATDATAIPGVMPGAGLSFCDKNPSECIPGAPGFAPASKRDLIREVNAEVDRHRFIEDMDQYGVADLWSLMLLPSDIGDCEDFALTKRHLLIADGVPAGAMTLAIVGSAVAPHMVLLVRFTDAVWILDNLAPDIALDRSDDAYRPVAVAAWGDITKWHLVENGPIDVPESR